MTLLSTRPTTNNEGQGREPLPLRKVGFYMKDERLVLLERIRFYGNLIVGVTMGAGIIYACFIIPIMMRFGG